jgi:hypothetical protein
MDDRTPNDRQVEECMRRGRGAVVATLAAGVALLAPASALAGGTMLKADLTGEQEVPSGSGAPAGEGSAQVNLKPKKGEVCFDLDFQGIAGRATSSGIFAGKKGEDGATKVVFFEKPQNSPVSGCVEAKKKPRQYHVNVESKKYPDGAIRGQLKRG